MAFSWVFVVTFAWLFRGPHFGQILRILALEKSSDRQHSKKGSEKVLGRVLGKGSQKGSEKGACYGFYRRQSSEEGSQKGF